jgi:osmotically-inducible protein OsmY
MNTTPTRRLSTATLLAAGVLSTLALTACNRPDDDRTAGQKLDSAVAKTEQSADNAAARTENAANRAADKMENAANKMGSKAEDVAVTAKVNAALAGDARLSALKINVDTVDGRVSLHGFAPDADSRARATELAKAVEGVKDVDNQLQVGTK